MAIDVCFSILQYSLSPISSFLLWNVIHTCLKNGVDVVTRDYLLVLVWLRSCWVGIEYLFKIKNSDQMAGLVSRLLNMSFQEQCSVQFITYWRCKGCIFNGIEHVLPDCDCTVMTYTSPYKSGHSHCLGSLLRPVVLESSVAMTTISLWAVVMDTKGPWWSPRDDSESGLHKDIPRRIFTSVVGKQPDQPD